MLLIVCNSLTAHLSDEWTVSDDRSAEQAHADRTAEPALE